MKCPICKKNLQKKAMLVKHIDTVHPNDIPKEFNTEQYIYYTQHGTINGTCMCGCGKPTEWNYKTGKPYKIRDEQSCRDIVRARALKNGSDGSMLKNPEHQRFMQESKGKPYVFKDGALINILSTYEETFLRFCEDVMEFTSREIVEAWQIFEYNDNGVIRKYMPDFYLPDYNAIIEIKANNKNPEYIKETGYKVALKDNVMKKQKEYNYIKIIDNNFGPFLKFLFDIVHSNKVVKNKKNLVILENTDIPIDPVYGLTTYPELYIMVERNNITNVIVGIYASYSEDSLYTTDPSSSGFIFKNINQMKHNLEIYRYIKKSDDDDFPSIFINELLSNTDISIEEEETLVIDMLNKYKVNYSFGSIFSSPNMSDLVLVSRVSNMKGDE